LKTSTLEHKGTLSDLNQLSIEIPLMELDPDPEQPRKVFDKRAIQDLKESIETHGILQPLVVRPRTGPQNKGRYWIVAGERRFRAAQLLGLEKVPCTIRTYTNMQALVISLVENLHREDLDAIEKCNALHRLRKVTDKTWDEIAELVKLSASHVKTLARLDKLDEEVKEQVKGGALSDRKAIALLPLPAKEQVKMAKRAVEEGLTAEQIREEVQTLAPSLGLTRNTVKAPELPPLPPLMEEVKEESAGPVVSILNDFVSSVRKMDTWMDSRTWSPSQVSESQKAAVEELYHTVSNFQVHLIRLRNGWKYAQPVPDKPNVPEDDFLAKLLLSEEAKAESKQGPLPAFPF
jgi:ParB family transcriptional regulator, chromosome partitioning protein